MATVPSLNPTAHLCPCQSSSQPSHAPFRSGYNHIRSGYNRTATVSRLADSCQAPSPFHFLPAFLKSSEAVRPPYRDSWLDAAHVPTESGVDVRRWKYPTAQTSTISSFLSILKHSSELLIQITTSCGGLGRVQVSIYELWRRSSSSVIGPQLLTLIVLWTIFSHGNSVARFTCRG